MQQLYGIAYHHTQSLDYKFNGSISYQARKDKRKADVKLERELDLLEQMVINSPAEDKRIDELYVLLCG